MKIIIFLYLSSLSLYSQRIIKTQDQSEDTTAIIFKAKILTLERRGVLSENTFDDFIKDIKYVCYRTKNFYFIVIRPNDYIIENKDKIALWGDCSYYIAYSIKLNKYYMLGGSELQNTNEFSKIFLKSTDIANYKNLIKNKELVKYLDFIVLKKNKKAEVIFPKCSEILESTIIIK